MILKHITNYSGILVITAARHHTDVFHCGDLDVVDPLAIPEWLEDRVGEAQYQHVLHGLLAQVVIDAEDLVLGEEAEDELIEMRCRFEITPERLLDDNPDPGALADVFRPRR